MLLLLCDVVNVVMVVMEMTFTYVSVHTRAVPKGARLATN